MTAQIADEKVREELLQRLVESMFSLMKQIRHGFVPQDPSLSPPQARLLFAIAHHKKEGASVKELAERTNVTPGAITQFVDSLVKKDLVKRYEDPDDRRIVRLMLTETAENQFTTLRKEFLSSTLQAFSALSNDEIKQLTALLAKVNACPKTG